MKKLVNKIKTIFRDTKYNYDNFGILFSFHFLICSLTRKFMYLNRRWAIKILENEFSGIIENIQLNYKEPEKVDKTQKTIYFFWAQGFDAAPMLVKKAVSIAKNTYSDYKIELLDMSNFSQYVHINPRLLNKYHEGTISIQTFSDIIRFNLLYQKGGIWMDATLFCFAKLPLYENICSNGFYSLNHNSIQNTKLWGKVYPVKYTTYFLCAKRGSSIMKACSDMYDFFYEKHTHCIDYFMNDYFLIICMKNKLSNDAMQKVPFNLGNPYNLEKMIMTNHKYTLEELGLCPQKCNWRNIDEDRLCNVLMKLGLNYENIDCMPR